MTGSGSDIWGTADGFQFYFQSLVGNGTVIGHLTSMSTGVGVDPAAKAGLMMRNDLTPGGMNAFINLMGTFGALFRAHSGRRCIRSQRHHGFDRALLV